MKKREVIPFVDLKRKLSLTNTTAIRRYLMGKTVVVIGANTNSHNYGLVGTEHTITRFHRSGNASISFNGKNNILYRNIAIVTLSEHTTKSLKKEILKLEKELNKLKKEYTKLEVQEEMERVVGKYKILSGVKRTKKLVNSVLSLESKYKTKTTVERHLIDEFQL